METKLNNLEKKPIHPFRNSFIYRLWRLARRVLRGPGWHVLSELPEFSEYEVGKWSYGNARVYDWYDGTKLRIGNFCSIHPTTNILLGGEHNPSYVTTHPIDIWLNPGGTKMKTPVFPTSKGDVVIGHDVFVGIGSTILSGVTIGDGAVLAAGSMVYRDVPPYAIVAGNPAKVVKYRFEPDIIARLEKLEWWHWPDEKIRGAQSLMLSSRVEEFLDRYEHD